MIGYYCTTGNDKDLFLIPWVLAGRECVRGMRYYHNPSILEELTLAMKDGRINKIQLESKGWEVREFQIPDLYLRGFIDACSKGRKNRRKIKKFSEEIYGFILGIVEEMENVRGYYEDDDDEDDDPYDLFGGCSSWE